MGAALALLWALFLLRVAGQGLARGFEPAFLPPDLLWHSATLPYPLLLAGQLAIATVMGAVVWRSRRLAPRPMLGRVLAWAALMYFAVMGARFIIGASGLADGTWFDQPIPTAFHLVLAAWLMVYAYALHDDNGRAGLRRIARSLARPAGYPVVVGGGVVFYLWLTGDGAAPTFAAYLAAGLAGSAIVVLELACPHRRDWRPGQGEVGQDALYVLLVQMLLPAGLTLGVLWFAHDVARPLREYGVWPSELPVAAQAIMMLLAADFMRYWLHRASHVWGPLWRLHAVHHAPKRLYVLNVARFHPADKALQFMLDTAPFVLLGVGIETTSLYFVFYAANGFFQHSNVDVRLGPLNWIVAGPELHRWHHVRDLAKANHNFGNNLIVWDALFGTRLPPARDVGALGIPDRDYPTDLIGQALAPFRPAAPTRERAE